MSGDKESSRGKVVVIGGGLGGLSAAIRLAKAKFSVHLYEASDSLGGKCRVENFSGHAFDTGPSLFTLPAVYRDLFLKTGAPLEDELSLKPVDPAFDYHFPSGKRLTLPNASRAGVVEAIGATFGEQSAAQWQALMDRAEAMWKVSREPFVESELRGFLPLLRRPGFLKSLRTIAPSTSLRKMASNYLSTPELITLIDRYATYTGSDPRKAPAVLLTIAYIEIQRSHPSPLIETVPLELFLPVVKKFLPTMSLAMLMRDLPMKPYLALIKVVEANDVN